MRTRIRGSIIGALALLAIAAPASAQVDITPARPAPVPNFLGTSGLLYTPNAYVLGDRAIAGHFHANADILGGGVVAGIRDRLELGLTVLDTDPPRKSAFNEGGDVEPVLNGKLTLLKERLAVPAISVGVIDALSELTGDPSWYVVASKWFSTPRLLGRGLGLQANLGYGDGVFDDGIFAGAELFLSSNISGMAEFQDENFNVGIRGRWGGLAASVGLFDLKHFGAGASYTLRF